MGKTAKAPMPPAMAPRTKCSRNSLTDRKTLSEDVRRTGALPPESPTVRYVEPGGGTRVSFPSRPSTALSCLT
jgi:hypothetical protein